MPRPAASQLPTADDLTELYNRDARYLLRFFMRRTFDPEASIDLVAETFAVAFEARGTFRGDFRTAGGPWVLGIARNQLNQYFRRGQIERRALGRLGVEPRGLTDAEYERIEELAGTRELREWIAAEAARLGPDQREILRLRVVEERTYREVATALGITEQTARTRTSRALSALRRSSAFVDFREAHEHA